MQYRFLALEEFPRYSTQVLTLLDRALAFSADDWTLEDAMQQYVQGEAVLFVVIDAEDQVLLAGLGSFVKYPKHLTFFVSLAAGSFATEYLDRFVELVKCLGVSNIEAKVRPSIARLLRRKGFNFRHIVVRKEV